MKEILESAKSPAIWLSFGKDSLLVLKLALAAGFDGPCYHFGGELSKFAKQVILEHDLTVYSWGCGDRYLIPDGEGLAQVEEFVIGSAIVPFVSPVVEGECCDHGEYKPFTRIFDYRHDITLTGYRKSDWLDAVGVTFPREMDLGITRIVNPVYDLTDEQVVEQLGFKPPEENQVEYCRSCLQAIKSSGWDRNAALVNFRRRFNFVKET